jgi:hypothetical protein
MSELALRGSELGLAMADTATVAPGSPLQVLELRRPHIHDGSWPPDEEALLHEALLGFVAVAAFQLHGVAALIGTGPPVPLHPLVTLVRGIAEACGQCWWHVEPWINDAGADQELEVEAWDRLSAPILARIELAHLDALAARRRRLGAIHGETSTQYEDADRAVSAYRSELQRRHAVVGVTVSGDRRRWEILGQKLPQATDLVIPATEYAYGQHVRGSGRNPYPLYSAYAHASLEAIFATAGIARTPLSRLHLANTTELRRLSATATRTFAAGYEIVAQAFGWDITDLAAWEESLRPFTLG